MAGITGPCPKCGNSITAPLLPPESAVVQNTVSPQVGLLPRASQVRAETTHSVRTNVPHTPPMVEPLRSSHIEPLPVASVNATVEQTPAPPAFSSFTDSHAAVLGETPQYPVRKKKKPIPRQTIVMCVAVSIVLIGMVVVLKVLKTEKLGKPSARVREQLANVEVPVNRVDQNPDSVEKTLDGADEKVEKTVKNNAVENATEPEIQEPEVAPMPETKSEEITVLVEQFLKAKDYSTRSDLVRTKLPDEVLLASFVNKKWPLATVFLEAIDPFPAERLRIYRYHLNFGVNAAGFPADALLIVQQRGANPPKIELDPLFDTIGGSLRVYARSPNVGDTKLYGINEDDGSIPYYEKSPLKEQQDFYCIVNARQKCYAANVPNNEKKATLNLRAYTDGEEIAIAYCSDKAQILEIFSDQNKGLRWNQSALVQLTLQWNVKEDPKRPYLEVIEIKSVGWNR